MEKFSARTRGDMAPVLFDPDATDGPDDFYYMLRGGASVGNITILEPGTAGGEYVKTLGHYHPYDFSETYEVLDGEALMLLQKRKVNDEGTALSDCIEEFKVVRLKRGDVFELPLHFGHVLVNIGKGFLVTKDNSPSDPETTAARPHADYEPVKEMHGLAYFCIESGQGPALRKNPLYKEVAVTDFSGLPVIS
jgi:glucose-6-phosphate isomerase, archaeal